MNLRALFLAVTAAASLLIVSGCHSTKPIPPRSAGCNGGSARPEAPVVCIDDLSRELSADPQRVYAYDRDPKKPGQPMVILFFTRSGAGDFEIVQKSGNCIDPKKDHHCPPGGGLCRVHMLRRGPGDAPHEECKYDILMNGKTLDPFIVAKTCCGT